MICLGAGPTGAGQGSPSRTILVVSHAGPLRVLICLLLGLPVEAHWSFHVDRASLTIVDRAPDMGTLMLLNDRCHLAGGAGRTRRSARTGANGVDAPGADATGGSQACPYGARP